MEGPEGGGTGDVVVKVELLRQVAGGGGLNDVGLREERPIFAKACRLGEPGEVRESGVADKATGEAGTVDADLERRGRPTAERTPASARERIFWENRE